MLSLDAVYRRQSPFTIEELGSDLEAVNFRVSRASLQHHPSVHTPAACGAPSFAQWNKL